MKLKNVFLTLGLALGLGVSAVAGLSATQDVKVADAAETRQIYLNPGVWETGGARYQAWTWGGASADSWVSFVDSDSDKIYETSIPSDRTGMKILRKGPDHKDNEWQSWNDTGDVAFKEGKDQINITGWNASYSWGVFGGAVTPEPEPTGPSFRLVGGMNGWNTNDETYSFEQLDDDSFLLETTLTAGTEFKVVEGPDWYGANRFTTNSDDFSGSGDGNMTIVKNGDYRFTLPANFKTDSNAKGTITCVREDTEIVVEYNFQLVGTINDWSTTANTKVFEKNESTYTLKVDLKANDEVKVIENGGWYGFSSFTSNTTNVVDDGSVDHNILIKAAGTYIFEITDAAKFKLGTSKGTISAHTPTTKEVVDTFVKDYIYLDIAYNVDDSDTGACRGATGYYAKAKAAYNELTTEQKALFASDAEYENARTRLAAWATANNEVFDATAYTFTPRASGLFGITAIQNNDSSFVIIIIATLVIAGALVTYFLINKKRNSSK